MISLRKVFAQEIKQKEREGLAIESLRKQELEELDLLIAENERRNHEATRARFVFWVISAFKSIDFREEKEERELDDVKKEISEEIEQNLNKERLYVAQKSEEVKQAIVTYHFG